MKTMVSTAASGGSGATDSSDVLPPGAKAGPWQVERELGRGGMGAVYAVVHEEIGKRAALKVVHQRLLVPGFNCDRMLLEAKVVNQVGHPNIVDIFETGKLADGRPYIVMERLEGQALSVRADEGKLLADQVIAILLQVCDALTAAHAAGVVHRDLKLDNVFLVDNADEPTTPKVKLLDWGIAKVLSHDVKHTIEGQLVGTPQYLAPEQARGHEVSPLTDVYSLGVMAYELFLEQLPFEAETAAEVMAMHLRNAPPPPSELWPDIPPALENLLLAMLSKQAAHRPAVVEVARRLEAVREELQRRRAAFAPRLPTAQPIDPDRPLRRASSHGLGAGLAATERADTWQPPRKQRWQYAVGGLAILASAAMFWFSRLGDRPAAAATAESALMSPPPARDVAHVLPPAVAPAGDIAINADSDAVEIRPAIATPTDLAARAKPAAAHVAPPRPTVSRPPPPVRHVPVAPRRGSKVDPDGTFDVYR